MKEGKFIPIYDVVVEHFKTFDALNFVYKNANVRHESILLLFLREGYIVKRSKFTFQSLLFAASCFLFDINRINIRKSISTFLQRYIFIHLIILKSPHLILGGELF